ncbi:MAG: hypothetical protein CMN03_06270 [Roseibacillus sp.]|nr:hypothetical protein [Roseibacillus sp.]
MAQSHTPVQPSQKRPTTRHLRARTTGIRIVNRAAFSIFLLIGCVAMGVLSVPQMRTLRSLEEELARANAQESHVLSQREQKRRELTALRDDPAYLELVARDRLDLYRTGERVYRIMND